MEKIKLQKHQIEAIHYIKKALEKGKKQMLIDMPTGCGKGIVLAKTVETIAHRLSSSENNLFRFINTKITTNYGSAANQ